MKFLNNGVCVYFALATGLVGCGSNSSPRSGASPSGLPPAAVPQQPVQSLDGLSAAETLRIKYDQAELRCQLDFPLKTVENGASSSEAGSDSFTWDLLHNYSDKKSEQLSAKSLGVLLTVNLQIEKIEIRQNEAIQTNDGTYQLLYTPVIVGSFSYKTNRDISMGGFALNYAGHGPIEFFEGVSNVLLNKTDSAHPETGTSYEENDQIHLNCFLNTQLKSAYQNQFIKKH